jgi:hypothetical protein
MASLDQRVRIPEIRSNNECGTTSSNECGSLKGLLRVVYASSPQFHTITTMKVNATAVPFTRKSYEMILDRSSLQKWWNHHHHQSVPDGNMDNSNATSDAIVMELVQVLKTIHCNTADKTCGTNTVGRHGDNLVDITSVFIAMDVFQMKRHSGTESNRSHQQQQQKLQSDMVHLLLHTLKETLPQLTSLHLYNGPNTTGGNITHGSLNYDNDDDDDDDRDDTENFDGDNQLTDVDFIENRDLVRNIVDSNVHDDDDDDDDSTSLPVMISGSILASIVEASTLQSIIVARCLYLNDNNDVSTLAKAIQDHASLSSVHLLSAHLHPNLIDSVVTIKQLCLDPIIMALSSLKHLESLNITLDIKPRFKTLQRQDAPRRHATKMADDVTCQQAIISPKYLQQLIACTTLKDVTLWECQLNGSHLTALSNALLYGSYSNNHDVVQTNNSEPNQTLQFLSLRCNPHITSNDWRTFYTTTLPNCFSLQSIYNDTVYGLANCDPTVPVHGSTASTSKHREGIQWGDLDSTVSISKDTTTYGTSSSTAIAVANAELFLGLNSFGRGPIIQGTYMNCMKYSSGTGHGSDPSENDECVLDLLSDVSDTLSALYALIRGHPMMIIPFPSRQ